MSKKRAHHLSKTDFQKILDEFALLKDECYDSTNTVEKVLNQSNKQTRYSMQIGAEDISFDVYFKKNNTITVSPFGTEFSKTFASEFDEYLREHTDVPKAERGDFYCSNMQCEVFQDLKGYLKTLNGVRVLRDEDLGVNGWIFKPCCDNGDVVTLTYFESTMSMRFQGLLMNLYIEIKTFLFAYEVNFGAERTTDTPELSARIEETINAHLTKSYNNLDVLLQDLLHDALKYVETRTEFRDYGTWTFPALKALEGRLKQMFHFGGVTVDRNGFGGFFDKNNNQYELHCAKTVQVGPAIARSINDCYNYYNKNRHSLFHTDQLLAATRRLSTQEEAANIIFEVCGLIEKSYCELGR